MDSHPDKMEMLYRINKGAEKGEHYGLKLARVVPLPPGVAEHAELVSATLEQQVKQKRDRSPNLIRNRRMKLILDLKENAENAAGKSIITVCHG